MEACALCDGSGLLIGEPCPLCDDQVGKREDREIADLDATEEEHAVAEIARRLTSGEFRKVVVCTGAGISFNSGIPDFRSKGGLFERIRAELGADFPELQETPEIALSRGFLNEHPVEAAHVRNFIDHSKWTQARPCDCHLLLALLARKGLLHRVYTQNVDGMHQRAGVPEHLVVETHGSLARGNIVLYDDPIPASFTDVIKEDFPKNAAQDQCDFMLVIGSSLQVAPFCAVPNLAQKNVPRALVTREPEKAFRNAFSRRRGHPEQDAMYGSMYRCDASARFGKRATSLEPRWGKGSKYKTQWIFDVDCDKWARDVAKCAGWMYELQELRNEQGACGPSM
mmetsp:Transcript_16484/g.30417  ORF Transcript_16484/g.30417 Transcript_16484/m.30417 type:complete len:340 (-) Transcript_16484:85-1104(-)